MNYFGGSMYANKTAGIVTYSAGMWGGARCGVALRAYLSELGCFVVSSRMRRVLACGCGWCAGRWGLVYCRPLANCSSSSHSCVGTQNNGTHAQHEHGHTYVRYSNTHVERTLGTHESRCADFGMRPTTRPTTFRGEIELGP